MKTNHLTINVNMGQGCEENTELNINSTNGYPAVENSEHTISKLLSGKETPEQMEKILSEAQLGSIRVNPFLARNLEFPEEMAGVIGDGCIHLPAIFGGKLGHTDPNQLRPGQSTTVGVLVSSRGVIGTELARISGKSEKLQEGDEIELTLRAANGRKLAAWEMKIEDQDPNGGITATFKDGDPKKFVIKLTIQFKPFKLTLTADKE
ncbi:MAG TPA: hypothetical protein ENJ82_12535 [Bacteroidetes bacterium]|nr:hypothetical protein [Bacteroidota bacterium]